MVYYVYILRSLKDGRYYTGQTQHLEKRLMQHNRGQSTYTKRYMPWELFAYKECSTRGEAYTLEKRLKNLKSTRRMNEYIVRKEFILLGSQAVGGPEK